MILNIIHLGKSLLLQVGVQGIKKMIERIIKNKRVSRCNYCGKDIKTDYKVKITEQHRNAKFYHLSCYNDRIFRNIVTYKKELRELHKSKRKLKKYYKYMILEKLGDK